MYNKTESRIKHTNDLKSHFPISSLFVSISYEIQVGKYCSKQEFEEDIVAISSKLIKYLQVPSIVCVCTVYILPCLLPVHF